MAPHSLPQPPAALCNPLQPYWPLATPHIILQPPYGLLQLSGADAKEEMLENRTSAKKTHSLKVHDAIHYTTTPSHFENVWMFYIYLTTFSLEIRYYIVGAENCFKPKFHDLISISFLHGFSID
jgi:hypothetical protein